jgi:hypothetical protein
MAWSVAVGVVWTALRVVPIQTAPPPSLPPVIVTVPTTITIPTALTVPTAESWATDPITSPLTTSGAASDTPTTQPTRDAAPTPGGTPSDVPIDTGGPHAKNAPPPQGASRSPSPRRGPTRPVAHPPAPRLTAAAREAVGDFAPAEVLSLLAGLFLAANGVARRRGDLAHVRLDDRDAIVRFE